MNTVAGKTFASRGTRGKGEEQNGIERSPVRSKPNCKGVRHLLATTKRYTAGPAKPQPAEVGQQSPEGRTAVTRESKTLALPSRWRRPNGECASPIITKHT